MTIQEYNDIYKNPIVKSMEITSSGGVTITNTNICMEQMSLEESLCSENILVFGACESGCFKIRIADLNHNFEGEWLTVNQLVAIDDGGCLLKEDGSYLLTEDGDRISLVAHDNAIPYGRFKVFSDKPTNDRRWRDLTCYDAMYDILNAEVIEWYNGLTFPMTMKNFRDSFFTYLGITQETTTLVNDSFMIQGGFSNEGSLSGKTIITSICELNGVFGHISRQGQFEYISLPSTDSLTLDWYMDGTGAYEDYTVQKITGITAKSSEEDVGTTVGTDTNVYIVQDNPLIYGSEGTQGLTTALTNMLNNVKDITYRPFNVNTYGNPMLPLGTNLTITTRNQTINSFLMTRVLSGIQSLKDSISADGEQYVPSQVNSLRTETKRTKGKIHELVNNVDELRSTIYDEDTGLISEIQQLSDEIVLKVDANGNIVKVELSADPSTGSEFKVSADNIDFIANGVMNLSANNLGISSTNFSINPTTGAVSINGSVTCSDGVLSLYNSEEDYTATLSTDLVQYTYNYYTYDGDTGTIVGRSGAIESRPALIIQSGNPLIVRDGANISGNLTVFGGVNAYGYNVTAKKAIIQDSVMTTELFATTDVKSNLYKLYTRYNNTDYEKNFIQGERNQNYIGWTMYGFKDTTYLQSKYGLPADFMLTGSLWMTSYLTLNNQTANTVAIFDSGKRVVSSAVTSTELGYVSGATSNIQGQIDGLGAKSVSGNPIAITNAEAMNANSVVATITPTQTGSGTPSPTNVRPIVGYSNVTIDRFGKNLCEPARYVSISNNDITYTDPGGDLNITQAIKLKPGTYTASLLLKSKPNTARSLTFRTGRYSGTILASFSNIQNYNVNQQYSVTFTLEEETEFIGWLYGSNGGTFTIQMMIEVGSTATSYETYQRQTYTVQLGDTYYQGEIDLTSGVLRVSEKYKVIDGTYSWGNATNGYYLELSASGLSDMKIATSTETHIACNIAQTNQSVWSVGCMGSEEGTLWFTDVGRRTYGGYQGFKTFLNGTPMQIVYELATPIEIQLTPTQIELLENNNTITTNVTSLNLVYQANSTVGDTTKALDKRVTRLEDNAHIYGVEWDGSSTTKWKRTDASMFFNEPHPAINNGNGYSPFDNIYPWAGMVRIEDASAGTLVSIPKFWYKWTRDGAKMKLQIADDPLEGFHVSPAHMDRGDGKGERDVVYIGRYQCASDYKSKTGVMPLGDKTRAEFRTNIHALGSNVWQNDFAMWWTIRMLYLVEYADWDSQEKIGYGCGNNSNSGNVGYTDNMQYHTGTTQATRNTYGLGTQYRHIEGLWDNIINWCDGVYFSGTNVYGILNPANFSDSSGGTFIGTRPQSTNYVSAWNANPSADGFDWALYPSAVSGTGSTYITDQCYYNASATVMTVGGYVSREKRFGMFYTSGGDTTSAHSIALGSRLMVLP